MQPKLYVYIISTHIYTKLVLGHDINEDSPITFKLLTVTVYRMIG